MAPAAFMATRPRKLSARHSQCSSITAEARKHTVLFEKVTQGENVTQHEMVHLKKGRTPIDVSLTICPIMDGKAITGASVVARDITERKRAAGSLAQQSAAMKASMDGMAIIDHCGVCIYLNDAYAKIFGYADPERLIGASWEMFYFDEELNRLKEQIMPAVWRDGSWRGEAMGLKLNGGTLPLEISISSVDGGGLVQVVRDITERKKLEETLRNSSLKDDLTGLFNRRGLLKQAAPYFDFARRQSEKLLLLFIDLDGMKTDQRRVWSQRRRQCADQHRDDPQSQFQKFRHNRAARWRRVHRPRHRSELPVKKTRSAGSTKILKPTMPRSRLVINSLSVSVLRLSNRNA